MMKAAMADQDQPGHALDDVPDESKTAKNTKYFEPVLNS